MARIRQVRDVIFTRRAEDLDRSLTYKEIEVRALMQATFSAAGSEAGARSVQKWKLPRPGDSGNKTAKVMTADQAQKMFGSTEPAFSREEIAARAAELSEVGQ